MCIVMQRFHMDYNKQVVFSRWDAVSGLWGEKVDGICGDNNIEHWNDKVVWVVV